MGRAPCCDKMGVKKGPWSPEEDRKLIDYVQKHGFGNWRAIPRQAGLLRCGKSCRLRWTNYLRPDLKRGSLSPEEEQTIIRLHGIVGNRWSTIASYLPGRTDNEIKNIWNTHLKKRLTQTGTAAVNPVSTHPSSSCTVPTTPVAVNNCLSTPCSTVPTTPMAVNNCLSNSLAVQNMCYFPGSPNSECSFSSSKDSAPQFTAEQIELHGAEYDQNLLQTCSVHCHETDEMRSAHDYINSLKTFLDIAEESTPQEIHGVEYADLAGVLDHITEDYDAETLDYFNTELFFSHSTFSGNQLDPEILETYLADHSQEYSSSSDSLDVLSPEILLDLPENPVDVPGVVIPPLWMD